MISYMAGGLNGQVDKLTRALTFGLWIMQTDPTLLYVMWFLFHHDCRMPANGRRGTMLEYKRCPHLSPRQRRLLDDYLDGVWDDRMPRAGRL